MRTLLARFMFGLSFVVLGFIYYITATQGSIDETETVDTTAVNLERMLHAADAWVDEELVIVLQSIGPYASYQSKHEFLEQSADLLDHRLLLESESTYEVLSTAKADQVPFDMAQHLQEQAILKTDEDLAGIKDHLQEHAILTMENGVDVHVTLTGTTPLGISTLAIRIEGSVAEAVLNAQQLWHTMIQEKRSVHSVKAAQARMIGKGKRAAATEAAYTAWNITLRGTLSGKLSVEQPEFQSWMKREFQAELLDEYVDARTTSLSYYSQKLDTERSASHRKLDSHGMNTMNLQLMLHTNTVTDEQEMIIGYPAIGSLN